MDTRKRVSLTFAARIVSRSLLLLRHVLIVPLFIAYWGAEYYGDWLVCAAVPTAVALGGLGVGAAANVRIATALARQQEDLAATIFTTGLIFAVAVWSSSIALLAVTISSLKFSGALQLSHIPDATTVAVILTTGAACMSLLSHFEGLWVGLHKAHLFYWFQNGFAITEVVTVAIGLVEGLLASQLAYCLLFASALFLIAGFLLSGFALKIALWASPSFVEFRSLLRTGPGFQMSLLWHVIYFQGSIVVASSVLGPTGAANWGTLRALSRSAAQFLGTIGQSAYPELQVAVGKADTQKIKSIHSTAVRISVWVGLLSAIGFMLLGPYVYNLWTLGRFDTPITVWPMLAGVIFCNSLWLNSEFVHRAMNRPWWIYSVATLAACIAVCGMILFGPYMGIAAFSAMALTFELIMAVLVFRRSIRIIGELAW